MDAPHPQYKKLPVRSEVEPGYLGHRLPDSVPYNPEPLENILEEMLSTVGFNWLSSPAATELESIVIDWIGKMLCLPKSFLFSEGGGVVLQGTTCEAILCTLAAARDRKLKKAAHCALQLVVYASDQTHCALQKAAQIAGTTFVPSQQQKPATLGSRPLSMWQRGGLVPLYACSTIGTTSSTAVDPLEGLDRFTGDFGVWLHHERAQVVLYEPRLLLPLVEEPRRPGAIAVVPTEQGDRVEDGGGIQGLADRTIEAVPGPEAQDGAPELRGEQPPEPRPHGQAVRGAHERRPPVRDRRAEDVRHGVLQARTTNRVPVGDRQWRGAQQGATRGRELDRAGLHDACGVYIIRFAAGGTLTERRHVSAAWRLLQEQAYPLVGTCET
ncbi:hypothetical protein AMTR_s00024p00231980 [Amborella trichopoda]|uniref:Tyrosine decarboxylase n=1 Tax=Amborella trichopoda TaxID=13333 RepID=W1PTU8_AMBTC|nr:hypothetical protein AMTR_s00024p00231980 [Amborella trichopoda]